MSMILRTAVLLTVALLVAMPAYATWSTLDRCTAQARSIVANADPQDRDTPTPAARAITGFLPVERLPRFLAALLLDSAACAPQNRTSWPTDHPALSWWLRQNFDDKQLTALYASTAEIDKTRPGLAAGARQMFGQELSTLNEHDAACLVRYDLGLSPSAASGSGYQMKPADLAGCPPPSTYPVPAPVPNFVVQ